MTLTKELDAALTTMAEAAGMIEAIAAHFRGQEDEELAKFFQAMSDQLDADRKALGATLVRT